MVTSRPVLLESLAAWPDTVSALRPARPWADDPQLGRFPNPSAATRAAAADPAVFALLARHLDDPDAATACLSALAGRLLPIARRWARSGLRGDDLADAEATLIAEAFTVLRADPDLTPEGVRLAWHRVHNDRRTTRARAARCVPLAGHHLHAPHLALGLHDPLRSAIDLPTRPRA